MKNIILVGFMGTGKTSVAKALARRLKMKYISTDALIERREHMSIGDIFAKKGEPYFRDLEAAAVKEVSGMNDAVVDAGGGVILRKENINNLKTAGVIVCLEASVDTVLTRTARSASRPLLNVDNPRSKIETLLRSRAPFYAQADVHINTDNVPVEAVADNIAAALNTYGKRCAP